MRYVSREIQPVSLTLQVFRTRDSLSVHDLIIAQDDLDQDCGDHRRLRAARSGGVQDVQGVQQVGKGHRNRVLEVRELSFQRNFRTKRFNVALLLSLEVIVFKA